MKVDWDSLWFEAIFLLFVFGLVAGLIVILAGCSTDPLNWQTPQSSYGL
jgi:hypothetical protein